MPGGDEVMVPMPVPSTTTVSACSIGTNVAVTERAASIVTVQSLEPEQSPDHESKVEPASAAGVSATSVPWS
jgi:hypothetical protein